MSASVNKYNIDTKNNTCMYLNEKKLNLKMFWIKFG